VVTEQLRRAWEVYGIVGRVYVAKEGVNAQISVPETTLEAFLRDMAAPAAPAGEDEDGYYDIPDLVRGVYLNADRAVEREDVPFVDLRVKPRTQVLADGFEAPLDWEANGPELEPEEWHERLEVEKSAVLVDCRNKYESEVGHFEGAELMDTGSFRESWEWFEKKLGDVDRDTPLMTYCTGGIRCVKTNAYLTQKMGFTNVNRLKGGIVNYSRMLREKPELKSKFIGVNHVFDLRIGERITDDVLTTCNACGAPCDSQTDCANEKCARPFASRYYVQCPECSVKTMGTCSEACRNAVLAAASEASAAPGPAPGYVSRGVLLGDLAVTEDAASAGRYAAEMSSEEPEFLRELREKSQAEYVSRAHMLSGTVQGRLLSLLASMISARNVLELGTFTGYSAGWLALALPADGRLTSVESDPELAEFSARHLAGSPVGARVTVIHDNAQDFVASDSCARLGPFDFVFLDANKKAYGDYYAALLDGGLLRVGGILVVDNVLFRGRVAQLANGAGAAGADSDDEEAAGDLETQLSQRRLRRRRVRSLVAADKIAKSLVDFNRMVKEDARTEQVMLPIRDGLTIVRRVA